MFTNGDEMEQRFVLASRQTWFRKIKSTSGSIRRIYLKLAISLLFGFDQTLSHTPQIYVAKYTRKALDSLVKLSKCGIVL
jgi:hypothetical protein